MLTGAWLEGSFPDTHLILGLKPRVPEPDHEAVFALWNKSLLPWLTARDVPPDEKDFVAGLIEMINDPPYPRRPARET
jgi:hypothetical protein